MHGHLEQDGSVLRLCHPLIFQTFKPVQTTASGDGSCLYHALSLTLTGTEMCTDLLRVLAIHALVKFKATMMNAFRDAFPFATEHDLQVKFNTGCLYSCRSSPLGHRLPLICSESATR